MCWKCKTDISTAVFISRTSVCPVCSSDLHSCKNCTFYAPGSHYDCHESVDENVSDKEKANFCDFFKAAKSFSSDSNAKNKADEARKAFDALFN